MIAIDFQGGAHGNFLEFACNVMAGVKTNDNPFNSAGAAHSKLYLTPQVFYADHYSFSDTLLPYDHVVAIKIDINDLLPLSQISLLRAGDYGYDNDTLEIDTYNKLNNINYRWVLDNIMHSFFADQIETSYNSVKDPSWPEVRSLTDFENLPEQIRNECIEVHKLELLELSEEHPNCPRHILREFFQVGFTQPDNHGFITQQHKMQYNENIKVYNFPFKAFYNTEEFMCQVKLIANWANLKYNTYEQKLLDLHSLFLTKQPYKDSKIKCDQIVQQLINNNNYKSLNKISLIEEAYINAILQKSGHECRY